MEGKLAVETLRDQRFFWICEPGSWEKSGKVVEGSVEGRGGSWGFEDNRLFIKPDAKKDYWRKTYYEPILIKDDGPCYVVNVPSNLDVTMETTLELNPSCQFDQVCFFYFFF